MKLVLFLISIEIKAYLRNWGAVFWTFAYPVALLALLSIIFGKQQTVAVVDVEFINSQDNAQVQLFAESLNQRIDMIDGLKINPIWLESKPNHQSKDGAIRIEFSDKFGSLDNKSSLKLTVHGAINEHNGGFISIISETAEVFNRYITKGQQLIYVDYSDLSSQESTHNNYDSYLISGLTALTVVSTAMFGFCTVLVTMRQNGSLKMYQVFPLSKFQFLLGFILSRTIILFVFCLAFFYGANLALNTGVSYNAIEFLQFSSLLIAGIIAFLSAGLLLVSVVKNGSTAVAIINIVNLPILFLSDLFMPVAIMPDMVRAVAEKSPVYLFVNSLRNVADPSSFELTMMTLFSLLITGLLCLAISAKTFNWRNA